MNMPNKVVLEDILAAYRKFIRYRYWYSNDTEDAVLIISNTKNCTEIHRLSFGNPSSINSNK